jgi:hypothetical protein
MKLSWFCAHRVSAAAIQIFAEKQRCFLQALQRFQRPSEHHPGKASTRDAGILPASPAVQPAIDCSLFAHEVYRARMTFIDRFFR